MTNYTVLLFYKYVPLADPAAVVASQKELCTRLNLKGRLLIADEGINGTLAGTTQETNEYIATMQALPEFADIEWKQSSASEQVFPKLKVKLREEIVTLGQKKQGADVSLENKAHYIEPEELCKLYEENTDFIILDARNEYEAEIGKFKNALIPPIDNFREFPEFARKLEKYKNVDIVTYCTGGIRCEKASAYLREQGFTKVRQLHGGVHVYAERVGGKHFEGELFVFDKRLHMQVNTVDPSTIAHCEHCQEKVTRYVDCADRACPELFICCASCEEKYSGYCPQHSVKNDSLAEFKAPAIATTR